MIYLDKNTYTMFHTEEKCKDYIIKNMYEIDLGYFAQNDHVQQKVVDLLGMPTY